MNHITDCYFCLANIHVLTNPKFMRQLNLTLWNFPVCAKPTYEDNDADSAENVSEELTFSDKI